MKKLEEATIEVVYCDVCGVRPDHPSTCTICGGDVCRDCLDGSSYTMYICRPCVSKGGEHNQAVIDGMKMEIAGQLKRQAAIDAWRVQCGGNK